MVYIHRIVQQNCALKTLQNNEPPSPSQGSKLHLKPESDYEFKACGVDFVLFAEMFRAAA